MRAMVYRGPYKIRVEEKPMPVIGQWHPHLPRKSARGRDCHFLDGVRAAPEALCSRFLQAERTL